MLNKLDVTFQNSIAIEQNSYLVIYFNGYNQHSHPFVEHPFAKNQDGSINRDLIKVSATVSSSLTGVDFHYNIAEGKLFAQIATGGAITQGTSFSINIDKFLLPYTTNPYEAVVRVYDNQEVAYFQDTITITPVLRTFTDLYPIVVPSAHETGKVDFVFRFTYDIKGADAGCGYQIKAPGAVYDLTNLAGLAAGVGLTRQEGGDADEQVFTGPCPTKGQVNLVIFPGAGYTRASTDGFTDVTLKVWEKQWNNNQDKTLTLGETQGDTGVKFSNTLTIIDATLVTPTNKHFGSLHTLKYTWTTSKVYPVGSTLHFRPNGNIRNVYDLVCKIGTTTIPCDKKTNGLIELTNAFPNEVASGTAIELEVGTIQLPYCTPGDDTRFYLNVKSNQGHDLDIAFVFIPKDDLTKQSLQITPLKDAADGFVFSDVINEYNSLKFIFDHAAKLPERGYVEVNAPVGANIYPDGTFCANAQSLANAECAVINQNAEKGVKVYNFANRAPGTAEVHFYRFKNPNTAGAATFTVKIEVDNDQCQDKVVAEGTVALQLKATPSSTAVPDEQFDIKPETILLGAPNKVHIQWVSQNDYPANALGAFNHGKAMTPGQTINCVAPNANARCEAYNDYIIKASNLFTGAVTAGTNITVEIHDLQNPYCELMNEKHLKFSIKNADGHDIDRIHAVLRQDAFKKDMFEVKPLNETSQNLNHMIGEKNTVRIAFRRTIAIKRGSYLTITLPGTAAWDDGESTCTPVSGLDGGVCERVRGTYNTTLKIHGLTGTGPGESVIELANFYNPTYPGPAYFKIGLKTEDMCEYGYGYALLRVKSGDGPGPDPSNPRGSGKNASILSILSVTLLSLMSLFALMK